MKSLLLALLITATAVPAQQDPLEGVWQGFDGEWLHVSRQLLALAEAIPPEKYAWHPATGVRSTGEIINHITLANFHLLALTGPPLPADLKSASMDKDVVDKKDVIAWLRRSLAAVKAAHSGIQSAALERKLKVMNRDATVDGMYLRIIVHANEHMGQLVAYARVNGIVPPWSDSPPAMDIGRRSPAFPVTPPGVRVRTGRFGGLSYGRAVSLGIPSESK